MKLLFAALFVAVSFAGNIAAAGESEHVLANKREHIIGDLERRVSNLKVDRVVARQQILDAGPELGRKRCDALRTEMMAPRFFEFARSQFKQLQGRQHAGKFTPEQAARLVALKAQITEMKDEPPPDCKALAPINP